MGLSQGGGAEGDWLNFCNLGARFGAPLSQQERLQFSQWQWWDAIAERRETHRGFGGDQIMSKCQELARFDEYPFEVTQNSHAAVDGARLPFVPRFLAGFGRG